MADDENKADTHAGEAAESSAPATGGEEGARVEIKLAAADNASGRSSTQPKSFWWRALLMVAAVVILFVIIRDMAKGPQYEATPTRGDTGVSLPGNLDKLEVEGEVIVEEAPSAPPAETTAIPPAYYGYSYPQPQPYYQQPQQSRGPVQPSWPLPPPGPYTSPHAQQPWYSPYPYWSPPAPPPAEPAPEQQ